MSTKPSLFAAFLLMALNVSAQTDIAVKGDTLVLPNGSRFWKGQQVTLAHGSLPDNTFNYIYEPELFRVIKKKPLAANFSGQTGTVIKFQRDGAYKGGYSYNILVLEFSKRKSYWCDVTAALANNEIIDTSTKAGKAASDKDVRLAKLKKLLDAGDITGEEYQTLRNKILNDKPVPTKKSSKNPPIVF